MNPEDKKLLEESVQLSRENNTMLKKMLWVQRRGAFIRWTYWIIIIVLTIGSFFFIQPYLNSLIGVYSGQDINSVLNNLPSSK